MSPLPPVTSARLHGALPVMPAWREGHHQAAAGDAPAAACATSNAYRQPAARAAEQFGAHGQRTAVRRNAAACSSTSHQLGQHAGARALRARRAARRARPWPGPRIRWRRSAGTTPSRASGCAAPGAAALQVMCAASHCVTASSRHMAPACGTQLLDARRGPASCGRLRDAAQAPAAGAPSVSSQTRAAASASSRPSAASARALLCAAQCGGQPGGQRRSARVAGRLAARA